VIPAKLAIGGVAHLVYTGTIACSR
jgi:hypothetical protein